MSTDTPPEVALRQYLLRRGHAARRVAIRARWPRDLGESVGVARCDLRRVAGVDPLAWPRAREVILFPTLRFLDASKLLPTRRTRIHDAALLLVRIGILLAAVAALARPVWLTANRRRVVNNALARAIIVERGAVPAESLATNATTHIVVQTQSIRREISGAVQWLERQPGRRELIVVSSFRRGSLDSVDLATVPRGIGIRLDRVPATDSESVARAYSGAGAVNTRTTLNDSSTSAEWTTAAATPPAIATLIVRSNDRPLGDAATRAALSIGVHLPLDSRAPVTVVYRGLPLPQTTPIDSPWMTTVAARIRGDSTLIAATSRLVSVVTDTAGLVIARDSSNRPAVIAKRAGNELLLVAGFEPASLASAALLSAIAKARTSADAVVPAFIGPEVLARWQRASLAGDSASALNDESDGRWFWAAALILLGLETWMRRARRAAPAETEIARDRAA